MMKKPTGKLSKSSKGYITTIHDASWGSPFLKLLQDNEERLNKVQNMTVECSSGQAPSAPPVVSGLLVVCVTMKPKL